MKAIDFFCGAGGLTRGLLDAGIDVLCGIDSDSRCRETYESNNEVRFHQADVRKLHASDLRRLIASRRTKDLLFAGCAPCQPFSQYRRGGDRAADGVLLGAFAKLVADIKPGQVFVENVPGLTKVRGFSTYRRFLKVLVANGYKFTCGVINARDYGIPQNRRRFILIAMRGVKPTLPSRLCGTGLAPFATVREAISHFPPIRAGETHPRISNHAASDLSDVNLERLRHTPHDGGDRRVWPLRLWLECHRDDYNGHTDVYGRMAWDAPAPTLTGRCHSISNGRYGHPTQDRAISLREAAALQTFDDEYVFCGSKRQIALQIGNAVPVRLAEELGRHIRFLRNEA